MTLEEKVDMLHGELNNDTGFYNAPIPRLGIPALLMDDGRSGVRNANLDNDNGEATLLPAAINIASSFDPHVAEAHSQVEADETRATGQNSPLAPSLNVARNVQNGRTFENFGEDPLLQAAMGAAYVRQAQNSSEFYPDGATHVTQD